MKGLAFLERAVSKVRLQTGEVRLAQFERLGRSLGSFDGL